MTHDETETEVTALGIRPSVRQLTRIALLLDEAQRQGHRRVMLAWLPDWKQCVECRTEELVEMIEYLVETSSPLIREFGLDMHLVDAIIQCRLRREGRYDRAEWTGIPENSKSST